MVDTLDQLRAIGALKRGHFLFSSGRHGDVYLEKFDLLRDPGATSDVCRGFVERFRDQAIDVVVGPTTGGILLAFETARQLRVAAAYAERASDEAAGREFRRGTSFAPGSRVLVVDDILTTGGSVRETLAALERHPVEVVAVAVLVDRSGGEVEFGGIPLAALASQRIDSWLPEACPMCAAGEPVVKPGTTGVPAPR
ncbi:MAG: Orotate phosphoribosyltransferase [uncultured Thermomicrobiales bacterium]|uniref:Orotate phosphoribosyltransferase n=1 Tax=uncultured Thermomicrobiales bacterium TaxID=1645740 RepID=A0A6J4VP25_9BACT|nr:MAG: Orotate phosphoribosyltransferase [uncultured Thermomicrobiales bacterium]